MVDDHHAADVPEAFEQLCEIFDEGGLIICVGPLLSAAAKLPSLDEVALDLIASDHAARAHVDRDALKAEIRGGNTPWALEILARRLGRAFFTAALRESLDDRRRDIPTLAHDIAALRSRLRAVYTTNLDRLVERAFEGAWPSFPWPRAVLSQRRRVVLKLRGDLQSEGTWVLTKDDQRRSRWRQLFDRAYNAHHMLFVAFDVNDRLLSELLELPTQPEEGELKPSHFIVFDGPCSAMAREKLEHAGVIPVPGTAHEVLDRLATRSAIVGSAADGGAGRPPLALTDTNPDVDFKMGCPFPGLQPFSYDLREVFFGRYMEVSAATAQLGQVEPGEPHHRWLAVEGPSGVGKSSFVHAGVVPALRRGFAPECSSSWRFVSMRPGRRPLRALARASVVTLMELARDDVSTEVDALEAAMRESPRAFVDVLTKHDSPREHLLLFVDQLEEIVISSDPADREPFAAAITAALDAELIYLVTTLRSDHVPQLCVGAPALAEAYSNRARRYLLPPISRVGLREAITRPVHRSGCEIEPALVERILSDADDRTLAERRSSAAGTDVSTLALAAHVLRILWEAGAAKDGVIELKEYEAAGGLEGALGASADRTLNLLTDPREREGAKRLFLGLVDLTSRQTTVRKTLSYEDAVERAGGGKSGRRVVSLLSGPPSQEKSGIVSLLLGGKSGLVRLLPGGKSKARGSESEARGSERPLSFVRLLVVHHVGDDTFVDLVHESLITGWRTYADWIAEHWSELVRANRLASDAKAWASEGRPPVGLSGDIGVTKLLEVKPQGSDKELIERYQDALKAAAERKASRVEHKLRTRYFAMGAAIGTALALVLAAGIFVVSKQLWGPRVVDDHPTEPEPEPKPENELEPENARELGLRASRLAAIPGRELEALELAKQAVGSLKPSGEPPPREAIDGLVAALVHARMRRTLRAHDEPLTAALFVPDGSRLITTGEDGRVLAWEVDGGGPPACLDDGGPAVTAAVVSRDGGQLVTASESGSVSIWSLDDLESHELPSSLLEPVTDLAISPDARTIVALAGGSKAALWRVGDDGWQRSLLDPGQGDDEKNAATAVAFSPDGARFATGDGHGQLRLWAVTDEGFDGRTPAPIVAHAAEIRALEFSPSGAYLASLAGDGSLRIRDPRRGSVLPSIGGTSELVSLAWAPTADGLPRLAAAAIDGSVLIHEVGGGSIAKFRAHRAPVTALAFSDDAALLVTGSADHSAGVWAVATGERLAELAGHSAPVVGVALRPRRDENAPASATELATASADGTARLWRVGATPPIVKLDAHRARISALRISPTATALATSDEDHVVHLWDGRSGEWRAGFHGRGPALAQVAFSPDGATLATVDKAHAVELWRVELGERDGQLAGEDAAAAPATLASEDAAAAPATLAFADGVIVSVDYDGIARVWHVGSKDDPPKHLEVEGALDVATSGDGKWVAITSKGEGVRVWEAANMSEQPRIFDDLDRPVLAAALSHNGSLLAVTTDLGLALWHLAAESGGPLRCPEAQLAAAGVLAISKADQIAAVDGSGSAHLWSASAGTCKGPVELPSHERIESLAFDREGARIITSSPTGVVRIWDASTHEPLDLLRTDPDQAALVSAFGSGFVVASRERAMSLQAGVVTWAKEARLLLAANREGTAGEGSACPKSE